MPSESEPTVSDLVTCCAGLTRAVTTLNKLLRKFTLKTADLFGDDDDG